MKFPSWIELHAAITHFPIALLLLAVAVDFGAYTLQKSPEKQQIWRQFSLILIGVAFFAAWPSLLTGYLFGRNLSRPPLEYQNHWIAAVLATILSGSVFVWRWLSRDNLTPALRLISLTITLLGAIAVGWTGHLGGQMVFGGSSAELIPISTAQSNPTGADAQLIAAGKKFYFDSEIGCTNCHQLEGKGGRGGPPLDGIGTTQSDIEWHIAHIRNPKSKVLNSKMPAYDDLSQQQLRAIAAFLVSNKDLSIKPISPKGNNSSPANLPTLQLFAQ